MPRDPTTGVYTRVSNSFSQPFLNDIIDPTDADALWDDLTDAANTVTGVSIVDGSDTHINVLPGGTGAFGIGIGFAAVVAAPPQTPLPLFTIANEITGASISYDDVRNLSVITPTANGAAYAAFDNSARAVTAFNYDHLNGFQDRTNFAGTGTLTSQVGFFSAPTFGAGSTTTARRGFRALDPNGAGTLTNNYGFYADALTRGTNNFGFYGAGTNKHYLGGNLGINTETPDIGGFGANYRTLTILGDVAGPSAGHLELAGRNADASGIGAGIVSFYATTNTGGPRVATIIGLTAGATALNRGGELRFQIKADAGALTNVMRLGDGLSVGTLSDPGTGMIYTNAATFMIRTKTSYANGAAAGAGTIANAPVAGNPTKWIPVDDNGVTRYIPAW